MVEHPGFCPDCLLTSASTNDEGLEAPEAESGWAPTPVQREAVSRDTHARHIGLA